ncbi:hypothetical protein M427DRAFT_211989 [Gonapodya prolifera JEL478]|uniref:Uncharacterized protein n=1 Tax=Gonapodya prolifera (strain JEL478) TaxID=1344416 RepID=A0A139APS0_GONPJ|nr:hypothetical protein M427DRAFT_211989 [Gonapodya prolifera JEL478]|eukprot:KXS18503.1 hypothetical protein M427DRAFT_211989 [Gonapodya prolifera JEL478]
MNSCIPFEPLRFLHPGFLFRVPSELQQLKGTRSKSLPQTGSYGDFENALVAADQEVKELQDLVQDLRRERIETHQHMRERSLEWEPNHLPFDIAQNRDSSVDEDVREVNMNTLNGRGIHRHVRNGTVNGKGGRRFAMHLTGELSSGMQKRLYGALCKLSALFESDIFYFGLWKGTKKNHM